MKARKMLTGLLLLTLFSCSEPGQAPGGEAVLQGQVVEFAPIVLKEKVSEERLMEASEKLQEEFLAKQKGFLKRELVRKSSGEYADLVYWDSRENAERAARRAMESPVCLAFFELMEVPDSLDASTGITYYERVSAY